MFIEQGIDDKSKFWKYLLGLVAVAVASFVGQLPMLAAILYENTFNGKPYPATDAALMHFFEPNLNLFLLLFSFVTALGGVYFVVHFLHQRPFLTIITGRKKVDWKRVLFSFWVWSAFTAASTLVSYYLNPADFEINFQPVQFFILLAIAVLLIPIQTTVEELVFRGYLMQGFANLSRNRWLPITATSIIFGLMHFSNPEVSKIGSIIMVYYIGTGLLLAVMTIMDDGLELALGFHAANNLVGALLVTSDWSALQTYSILKDVSVPGAGFDIILPVVVIYPVILLIFGYKYKWSEWVKKFTGNI